MSKLIIKLLAKIPNNGDVIEMDLDAGVTVESPKQIDIKTRYEIFLALEEVLEPSLMVHRMSSASEPDFTHDFYLISYSELVAADLFGFVRTCPMVVKKQIENNGGTGGTNKLFTVLTSVGANAYISGDSEPLFAGRKKQEHDKNTCNNKTNGLLKNNKEDKKNKKSKVPTNSPSTNNPDEIDEPTNNPKQIDLLNQEPKNPESRNKKILRIRHINPSGSFTVTLEDVRGQITISPTARLSKKLAELVGLLKGKFVDVKNKKLVDPSELDDELDW